MIDEYWMKEAAFSSVALNRLRGTQVTENESPQEKRLILPCTMMKNGKKYSKNPAVFTPQDFYNMFDHFLSLCMSRLKRKLSKHLLRKKEIKKLTQILWSF